MKLIIGLGNPGKEYENTRHSIGFKVVDFLNKEYGGSFEFDKKLEAQTSEIKMDKVKVILAKPQIFVNNSGQAVKKLIRNPKSEIRNLVVVHDDLDIPFGKIKVSFGRSSAGHKGIESIIKSLKTDKFYRIRIGTFNSQIVKIKKIKDKRKKVSEINKFVISPFSRNEKLKLNKIIKTAAEKALQLL